METKRGIGNYYEEVAKKYLILKKLNFIESNYYSKYGEIDLIFFDKMENILIFVEVKYRNNKNYGYPVEMVNNKKIEKIKITSQIYISKVKWKHNVRYDIIGITKKNKKSTNKNKINDNNINYEIEWIKNAF